MIISVMSDLHLEFRNYDLKWLSSLAVPNVDVAVFAGDISNWADFVRTAEIVSVMSSFAPTVIWVPGNHEYYGSTAEQATEHTLNIAEHGPSNVHLVTSPQVITAEDRKFFCGTLWYSRDSIKDIGDPDTGICKNNDGSRYRFSDFRWTPGLSPWVYTQNSDMMKLLHTVGADDVVVSHHLPTSKSTPVQFRGKPDNAFFVSDCTSIIKEQQPRYWFHGHTHTPCAYSIGNTSVIANPCGYANERPDDYKAILVGLGQRA